MSTSSPSSSRPSFDRLLFGILWNCVACTAGSRINHVKYMASGCVMKTILSLTTCYQSILEVHSLIFLFFSILKFDKCQNSVSIFGCTAHLRWTRACLLHGNIIRSPSKTPCTLTKETYKPKSTSDSEEDLCKGFNFDDPTCITEVTGSWMHSKLLCLAIRVNYGNIDACRKPF